MMILHTETANGDHVAVTVDAMYLDGYLGEADQGVSGELLASNDGLTFTWSRLQNLNSETIRFTIPIGAVTAVELEDVDTIRTIKSAAAGFIWGGTLGGLIAANKSMNRVLAVRCQQDGADYTVLFACTDIGGRTFMDGWQRERQGAGLPPLPTIEAMTRRSEESEQLEMLREISAKLDRLIDALTTAR